MSDPFDAEEGGPKEANLIPVSGDVGSYRFLEPAPKDDEVRRLSAEQDTGRAVAAFDLSYAWVGCDRVCTNRAVIIHAFDLESAVNESELKDLVARWAQENDVPDPPSKIDIGGPVAYAANDNYRRAVLGWIDGEVLFKLTSSTRKAVQEVASLIAEARR